MPDALDASTLKTLVDEWTAMRDSPPKPAVKALAQRIVAHRSRLFEANAKLQADSPADDDPATIAQTEANQSAIKTCTNLLTEMTGVLGSAFVPS